MEEQKDGWKDRCRNVSFKSPCSGVSHIKRVTYKHTKEEKHRWTDERMNGRQGLQVMHGAVHSTLPIFKTRVWRQLRAQTESRWSVSLPLLHHTSPLAPPASPMSGNCQQWINNPDINTLSLNEQQFLWDVKLHRVAGSFRCTAGCGLRPSACTYVSNKYTSSDRLPELSFKNTHRERMRGKWEHDTRWKSVGSWEKINL